MNALIPVIAVALDKLGIEKKTDPHATYHALGAFRLIDTADFVIDAVVERRLQMVKNEIDEAEKEIPEYDDEARERFEDFYLDHYFLDYERYLYILKNASKLRGGKNSLECDDFLENYNSYRTTPDRAGWFFYLSKAAPDFYNFLTLDLPLFIPDRETRQHTYVVARSGAGKSTLLKKLIWSYITKIDAAIVIIEPTHDFSREVAEFKEFVDSDRLIYLSGDLSRGQTFTINPFTISGVDATNLSEEAVTAKKLMADEIFEALAEIIGEGEGAGFSLQMKAVLKPCIRALLDYPDATLHDLQRFMDRTPPPELLELGRSLSHYPKTQDFFQRYFMGENYRVTKASIVTKLQTLFDSGTLEDMTCGRNTVDLERAVENRKVIVFNLAEAVVGASGAPFGRLVVSLLKGIAKRRALVEEEARTPIHCIIDECSEYICPSISTVIQRQRKYALILTLCQTEIGARMPNDIKEAVTGSTNIQIAGSIGPKHWSTMANLVNLKREDFEGLGVGEFFIRFGSAPSIKFKVGEEFVGKNHSMTPEQWARMRVYLLSRYYRPVQEPPVQPLVEIIPHERAERHPAAVRTTRAIEVTDVVVHDDETSPGKW